MELKDGSILNQTLNSFSTQISDGGISFNGDILEANLVNLILLCAGLFYLLCGVLTEGLSKRRYQILRTSQEVEQRLQELMKRFAARGHNFLLARRFARELQIEAEKPASKVFEERVQKLKSSILASGQVEIERLNSSTQRQLDAVEYEVRKKISDSLVSLVLQRVTTQLEGELNSSLRQQFTDENIGLIEEARYTYSASKDF
jgi:F0F1-type ATP synthase membrane subunit b/b'